jgi:hypothetical protein
MTPQEVLLKAAELLERRGWCQNELTNPETGAYCVLGALQTVCLVDYFIESEAREILRNKVYGEPPETGSLVDWNDEPGRTATEIISTLRAAAA